MLALVAETVNNKSPVQRSNASITMANSWIFKLQCNLCGAWRDFCAVQSNPHGSNTLKENKLSC